MDNQQETKFLYKLDINKVGSSETTCETLIFLFLFFHNPCPCPLGYFNFCLPRFWASGFYSYLHANICFPRFLRFWASGFYSYLHANICFSFRKCKSKNKNKSWLARMKACPCFCVGCSRIVSARQQPRQKGFYSYLHANKNKNKSSFRSYF